MPKKKEQKSLFVSHTNVIPVPPGIGVSDMINGTLQSWLRMSTDRRTDRASFAKAMSRLSSVKKDKQEEKPVQRQEKAA